MTMPAMGTITVSDNDCTIEKILPFHVLGVCPISAAIVPTLSFTSVNMPCRLDVIQPVSTSFMNSLSLSITAGIAYEKRVASCGMTVCAMIMMPAPAANCFIPWLFAAGLSPP